MSQAVCTTKALIGALLFLTVGFDSAQAATYTLGTLKEAPPKEVSPAMVKAVSKEGVRILRRGKRPVVDIWFRDSAPRPKPEEAKKSKNGVTLTTHLDEGAFLGILRFHRKHYDFRDKGLPAGVYAMRYAIQPQDGDHLGASPTRDFVLLSPVEKDLKLDPILTNDLVKLSLEVSKTKHPASLFLTAESKDREQAESKLPLIFHDKKHNWHIVDFRIAYEDGENSAAKEDGKNDDTGTAAGKKSLRLGLIVVGKAEE